MNSVFGTKMFLVLGSNSTPISLSFFPWRKTLDIDMNDSRPKKKYGVRFLSIDRWPEASTRDPTTITWSALVNIRRKVLLSSVGFRKRMTSRSPRKLICDSSALRSSLSDLFDFWWEILSDFFDHSSIDSNQFKHGFCKETNEQKMKTFLSEQHATNRNKDSND